MHFFSLLYLCLLFTRVKNFVFFKNLNAHSQNYSIIHSIIRQNSTKISTKADWNRTKHNFIFFTWVIYSSHFSSAWAKVNSSDVTVSQRHQRALLWNVRVKIIFYREMKQYLWLTVLLCSVSFLADWRKFMANSKRTNK